MLVVDDDIKSDSVDDAEIFLKRHAVARNKRPDEEVALTDVENSGNESVDSDCSCDSCATDCHCSQCTLNNGNMDCMDEPESDNDYTDESEAGTEGDFRDLVTRDVYDDTDVSSVQSRDSSHDEDMSAEVIDAYLDLSEDATPQAIEVDSSSSSMDVSASVGDINDLEDDEDFIFDDNHTEEEEQHGDDDEEDDFDEAVDLDGFMSEESDSSDFVEYRSRSSSPSIGSSRSRSRSPVSPRPQVTQSTNVPPIAPEPAASAVIDMTPKNKSTVEPSSIADTENDGLCCICLDGESNHVVVPCGHICLCEACKDLLSTDENHRKKKRCPICKSPYSIIIKTFK